MYADRPGLPRINANCNRICNGIERRRAGQELALLWSRPLIGMEPRPMEQRTDKQPVRHPRWCARGPICRVDGIHHSRPAPVTPGDAYDAVRVWLEQAHTAPQVSVVLETTVDGEVGYVYMTVGQARILVHQVRRLLDASKAGRR